jgi:cell division protein FtsB
MIDSEVQDPAGDAASIPAPKRVSKPRRRLHSTVEVRERRRKLLRYALAAGVAVLMVSALIGENGYLAGLRARRELEALANQVSKVDAENQQLSDQAKRLKDDPAAQEDAARRELGLVRQGETLVIVRDGKPAGK